MPIMTAFKDEGSVPVKAWTDDIEQSALDQLHNLATLPFIHKHIAVMPDVHWGMGSTVGSVIPTVRAIVPAAVGVDIGCGMVAHKLNLRAEDLPDNLSGVRSAIEAAIPHGRTDNGGHSWEWDGRKASLRTSRTPRTSDRSAAVETPRMSHATSAPNSSGRDAGQPSRR